MTGRMFHARSRVAWLGGVVLGLSCLGCGGGAEEKPVGEPVALSPGMEQMKKEMIASFQKTSEGKRVLRTGENP